MTASNPLEKTLLKLFREANDHKLSAKQITTKLATASKKSESPPDADQIDQTLTALIDDGHLTVIGAAKTGHHPRAKGSYRLSPSGKEHTKPRKPDIETTQLDVQDAYILLQFLRIRNGSRSMTRSDLNGKLKTKAAKQKVELDPTDNRETIDYHLHNLVDKGSLEAKRQGLSTTYTLTDDGQKALGAANQYDDISFTFTGAALNTLLKAARESSAKPDTKESHPQPKAPAEPVQQTPARSNTLEPQQIHDFIAHLKADKYAGRDLIPIHEVRTLVAHHHGPEAASHPVFDPILKRLRSEGELEIIAIADSRDTPQQHLDDAIPGMNETLFFIDTK